jgi:hypothetical protein
MPLMKGHSKEVVGSNIREMMKSGRPRNQAIAASLSSARKYKKMADGGMVEGYEEDDNDMPEVPMYADGGMVAGSMKEKDPEDYNRSITELQMEARSYPNEVANPETHARDSAFAEALRKKAQMEMGAEGANFAMGGEVESMPDEDDIHGATADSYSTMPGKEQGVEDKMERMPSGPGLSEEAKQAIMERKARRRYK